MDAKSFIEAQFPVSKISKESYKERKANYSQTLTGTGKWWGRKPLLLVRAAILGLLIPASNDPEKDRAVFLQLLTMDEEGLWRRKSKAIPLKVLWDRLTPTERRGWFTTDSTPEKTKIKKEMKPLRDQLQQLVFERFTYDEKLEYCDRPERIDGPSETAWREINQHLGTHAKNLPDLVGELGRRQFGHVPRVGDAFCGGGSIPFEAARIGCDAYGADLNPVAALLTWAALNVVGGGPELGVGKAQREVYDAVDRQVTEWGIEHNKEGHRADAFLYCAETRCPERGCGWMVPLAPSWVIGEKTKTIARLIPDPHRKRFDIEVRSGASDQEMATAKEAGTVRDSDLVCPNHRNRTTPIATIRGDRPEHGESRNELRAWENDDLVPRSHDTFQERLYCVRWVESWIDADGMEQTNRYYQSATAEDIEREKKVLELIRERFHDWQSKGYIPSRRIEPGDETARLIRERGWTHWHHLFTPRQLLVGGELMKTIYATEASVAVKTALLLGVGKFIDYNCRLCQWTPAAGSEKTDHVFFNQALNTLFAFGARSLTSTKANFAIDFNYYHLHGTGSVYPLDARSTEETADIWITDPPYADAISYHELSEFFIAWYGPFLQLTFPNWYTDSKRALAIKGSDLDFRLGMVEAYRKLATHTTVGGAQVVMFTHQDVRVWADLTMILWACGLRVSSAWCVATETDANHREGNYVQGTVLLVLRRQISDETVFLDELVPLVEAEVKSQLDSMLQIDDADDPNFGDTDYQLAAYAAALRVLTKYRSIEDIDVTYELSKARKNRGQSIIEDVIADAVKTACDHLVPKGFDRFTWKTLTPEERFYLKGLDLESHGEFRTSAYMELARGFGVRDYKAMLSSGKANQTRLKTASEFDSKMLGDSEFGRSLARNCLFATREALRQNEAQAGRNWLKTELAGYWGQRKSLIIILRYLASMEVKISTWKDDGHAAGLVAGALENDSV